MGIKELERQDAPSGGITTKWLAAPGRKTAIGQGTHFEQPYDAVELKMLQWPGSCLMASERGQ